MAAAAWNAADAVCLETSEKAGITVYEAGEAMIQVGTIGFELLRGVGPAATMLGSTADDTIMLFGALGWDKYKGKGEVVTEYFPSSGTGQTNVVFSLD
ncbi:hypothetical protein SAMN04488026_107126 [Aliiruegeria lutimaris]|uniref:Uncharacterized protein n=1 Tax=Aliiruegeria lutimaris TaxID=571298 RepID=A0A1G9HZW9_9RHOB|nr:hypothetical protein [Aliiruegeria lutimaris]SDL18402.1 hypothetical protein SAMN04488026_107126 [Aliiruegeria lutimaris]